MSQTEARKPSSKQKRAMAIQPYTQVCTQVHGTGVNYVLTWLGDACAAVTRADRWRCALETNAGVRQAARRLRVDTLASALDVASSGEACMIMREGG